MPIGAIIGAGIGLLGSSMQADAAQSAAAQSANAQLEAARIAAEEARFRPVGITTRFGTSQFGFDDRGRLTSAGYNVAPEIAAIRDRLLSQAGQEGLSAQAMQRAQGLFGLGEQFLPTSTTATASPEALAYAQQLRGVAGQVMPTAYDPTAAAQQYVEQQRALLQPERERTLAGVRQNLFNTGRGGLAVAQGGDLAATNPEMAAYYNALAQQERQLAAQGSEIGRQRLREDIQLGTTLGAGALDTQQRAEEIARRNLLSDLSTGTGLFSTGLQLASGGYAPLQTQIGLASTLEDLGRSPLDIGSALGGRIAAAGAQAGQSLLTGGVRAANALQPSQSLSPFGSTLISAAQNQQLTSGIGNWLSGLNAAGNPNYTVDPQGMGLGWGNFDTATLPAGWRN